MDGLIVKQPWADLIVKGKKNIEVRGCRTKKQDEKVAIVESGMNRILGSVSILGCIELNKKLFEDTRSRHLIHLSYGEVLLSFGYKKIYAWLLEEPDEATELVTCQNRKPGQVIWIKNALS